MVIKLRTSDLLACSAAPVLFALWGYSDTYRQFIVLHTNEQGRLCVYALNTQSRIRVASSMNVRTQTSWRS